MCKYEQIDRAGLWNGRLLVFESLPSTNQWVLDNIGQCIHGDVVLARLQTKGRGRFGRTWHSVPGRSLTLSAALLPPPDAQPVTPSACRAAALAVADTLANHGIEAKVKWPNDVLVDGRKIAGILAEAEPAAGATALGIGLNVNTDDSDFEGLDLMHPATSMTAATGKTFDTLDICRALVERLQTALDGAQRDPAWLINEWRPRDFLAGKRITVAAAAGAVTGRYSGLDSDGRLLLTDGDGTAHVLLSGDVSVDIPG